MNDNELIHGIILHFQKHVVDPKNLFPMCRRQFLHYAIDDNYILTLRSILTLYDRMSVAAGKQHGRNLQFGALRQFAVQSERTRCGGQLPSRGLDYALPHKGGVWSWRQHGRHAGGQCRHVSHVPAISLRSLSTQLFLLQ